MNLWLHRNRKFNFLHHKFLVSRPYLSFRVYFYPDNIRVMECDTFCCVVHFRQKYILYIWIIPKNIKIPKVKGGVCIIFSHTIMVLEVGTCLQWRWSKYDEKLIKILFLFNPLLSWEYKNLYKYNKRIGVW